MRQRRAHICVIGAIIPRTRQLFAMVIAITAIANTRMDLMTHTETFVIEVAAGLTVVTIATILGVMWRSIRRLEDEIDDHKVEAERRLTQLEDFKDHVEKSFTPNDPSDRSGWMHKSD